MKVKRNKKRLPLNLFETTFALILIIGFLAVLNHGHTLAQEACTDQIAGKSRVQLEQELEACNKEIAEWTEILNKTKKDSASFATDIAALTAKINAAQANIKGKNIAINNLTKDIATKQSEISVLDTRIDQGKRAIADILRKTNDINSYSLVEAIFQTKEKTYAQVLADRQAKAAQIRSVLFPLRDAVAIPFGTALQYAEAASEKTGVEAALILAILKQETNLGANVGTCNRPQDIRKWTDIMPGPTHYSNYLKNGKTCSGPNSPCSYRDDQTAFVRIIDKIDRYDSPEGVPLSCPWGAGWGGAMGPSQFIPTTWELFESKISSALGIETSDPWNPQHAIMATALYLKELIGSTGDPYTDQRTAACRYYSGRTCYVNG